MPPIRQKAEVVPEPVQVVESVIQNTSSFQLVKEASPAKQEAKLEPEVDACGSSDEDDYDSEDSGASADLIVPIRKNEASVTTLSRSMVRDYLKEKRSVRHYTPDLASRRVGYSHVKPVNKNSHALELESDEEERAKRLVFKLVPKFRSAMNTPYASRERQQLRQMVIQQDQQMVTEQPQLVLRNEATIAVHSAFSRDNTHHQP